MTSASELHSHNITYITLRKWFRLKQ